MSQSDGGLINMGYNDTYDLPMTHAGSKRNLGFGEDGVSDYMRPGNRLTGSLSGSSKRFSYKNMSGNFILEKLFEVQRSRVKHENIKIQRPWDVFRYHNRQQDKDENKSFIITAKKVIKILMGIVMFLAVIAFTSISKLCLFLITSNIYNAIQLKCTIKDNNLKCWRISAASNNQVYLQPPLSMQVKWIWALIIIVCTPYLLTTLRCLWKVCFKKNKKFTWGVFFTVLGVESLQSVGIAMFVVNVLPNIDPLRGESLMLGGAFIPAILNLIYRKSVFNQPIYKTVIDVLSIIAQASIFVVWPIVEWNAGRKSLAIYIAVSLFLISINWWENYISKFSLLGNTITQKLLAQKRHVRSMYTYIYLVVGIWKSFLIICLVSILVSKFDMGCLKLLYFQETDTFSCEMFHDQSENKTKRIMYQDDESFNAPFWIAIIQIISGLACYIIARNACKIMLQVACFSIPLVLSSPLIIAFFLSHCEVWHDNDFSWFDSKIMTWTCDVPDNNVSYTGYLTTTYYLPIVFVWWLSYLWVSAHIWYPNVERLVRTERLFVKTFFCDVFLQLSLTLNRRNDFHDKNKNSSDIRHAILTPPVTDTNYRNPVLSTLRPVSMIYVCATMWHETEKEIRSILTSIFRLDLDQSVRSYAQLFDVVDPNYYEFEAHIFFDDAFEYYGLGDNEFKVNGYVEGLIRQMNAAVNNVHKIQLELSPPVLYNTPYGGKMEWVMPGNNKLVVHLKNSEMIRRRKRWSQVMYMYYFLGYHIMGTSNSIQDKQAIADNTYVLALDGDVDFKPESLQLLVDRMKKNEKVGAACGRIQPSGSGPMLWFQRFEYSISHWLQKATEHVIGCVLCSPGCYSLFRASALMDDNVMRKYACPATEARHFVQYDQGEDRWLCTLLLQQGYRVEYCAASDAFTFAPEGFNEFFNQRRRWIPSTVANIFDVLQNWRQMIRANEDISALYILYQSFLFLLTLLTPGTIFLLIVGAISIAFPTLSLIDSFAINIVPVIVFVVICFFLSTHSQLVAAGILTCAYTLLMLLVIIGLILNMAEEGICSPTTIFFLFLIGIFIFAGLLHPMESWNIIHGPLYLLTTPSSGMLLFIYAICNMNKVNWGTRETAYQSGEKQALEERSGRNTREKWWTFLKNKTNKVFSLRQLFNFTCCQKPTDITRDIKINAILEKLEGIEKRIGNLPSGVCLAGSHMSSSCECEMSSRKNSSRERSKSIPNKSQTDENDGIGVEEETDPNDKTVNEWQRDLEYLSENIDIIDQGECEFWEELIKKYLQPFHINEEKNLKDEENLNALRNKVCLFFFLCNGVFTIVIFTLQYINSRSIDRSAPGLYISLPCYSNTGYQLRVEPISLLFMIMFGAILLIQFIAMVYHRLSTLHHIIASTHINCLKLNQSETSYMNILKYLRMVRDMIHMEREDDERSVMSCGDSIATSTPPTKRRKPILQLTKKHKISQTSNSLADIFLRNFMKLARDINHETTDQTVGDSTKAETNVKFKRRKSINAALKDHKNTVLEKADLINGILKEKSRTRLENIPEVDSTQSSVSKSQIEDTDNSQLDNPGPSNFRNENRSLPRIDELDMDNHIGDSNKFSIYNNSDSHQNMAQHLDINFLEEVTSSSQL